MEMLFIVDDDFVDGRVILQKLSAQRRAHQREGFDRKSFPYFGDQRQSQHQIAEKARLQD